MYIEDKESFVKEFGELLAKYGIEDVKEIRYEKNITDEWDTEEHVIVTFDGDQHMRVNVHMDSLPAIIRDVMYALR